MARRAARQLPARGQPVQIPEFLRLLFYTVIRHFSATVTKNSQTPEKHKFGKSLALQLVGRHVSHSSQPASRQALQPAVGQ